MLNPGDAIRAIAQMAARRLVLTSAIQPSPGRKRCHIRLVMTPAAKPNGTHTNPAGIPSSPPHFASAKIVVVRFSDWQDRIEAGPVRTTAAGNSGERQDTISGYGARDR